MNKLLFGIMAFSMLFLNSCLVSKKVVYVEDMLADSAYNVLAYQPIRVQKGDRLSIVVRAKTPELAAPFNMNRDGYTVNERGDVQTNVGTAVLEKGYLVDAAGEIDFPILGSLAVVDLSLDEVKSLIAKDIVSKQLINDPLVQVELLNLKINVMGEITQVGVLDVPEGRITLLDAISRAGGLTTNGAEEEIVVIRESNGQRIKMVNNLKTQDIFNAPSYHLQQNDIVYVMPKAGRFTPQQEMGFRYTSIGLSVITMILTVLTLTK